MQDAHSASSTPSSGRPGRLLMIGIVAATAGFARYEQVKKFTLLDHELMEFAATIPSDLKLHRRTTKWILKQAVADLVPPAILERGKWGFRVPVEQWLADVRNISELRLEPVSANIAALAGSLPEPMRGDPADRIIAATATVLGAALVTADDRLRSLPALRTIW